MMRRRGAAKRLTQESKSVKAVPAKVIPFKRESQWGLA